jgi:hypothetical protein
MHQWLVSCGEWAFMSHEWWGVFIGENGVLLASAVRGADSTNHADIRAVDRLFVASN